MGLDYGLIKKDCEALKAMVPYPEMDFKAGRVAQRKNGLFSKRGYLKIYFIQENILNYKIGWPMIDKTLVLLRHYGTTAHIPPLVPC